MPVVKEEGLAEFADIFCEKGVFGIEDSEYYLTRAKEMGFKLKVHADEMNSLGGAELAARTGAYSADHLLKELLRRGDPPDGKGGRHQYAAAGHRFLLKRALRPGEKDDRFRLCRGPGFGSEPRKLLYQQHPPSHSPGPASI